LSRGADLDAFSRQLKAKGVPLEKREDCEHGCFAWIRISEGYCVELYQPLTEPGIF